LVKERWIGSEKLDVTAASAIAADVLALFTEAGYRRVEPSILQPASVFLDLSGEEMRRRMFVTTDADGAELALRPEYTIPVALDYLAGPQARQRAGFAYCGPVFRVRPGESGEFVQAGIESFGRADREAADAEVIGLALDAVARAGLGAPEIRLGDVGLFTSLVDALALPSGVARRLRRAFAQGTFTTATLEAAATPAAAPAGERAGLLKALEGQNPKAARDFVEDILRIAGISAVGGRSAAEIAERFLEQAAAEAAGGLGAEARDVLERYMAIAGDPDTAAAEIRRLAAGAGLDLSAALDGFETRTGFMAARGIDVAAVSFAAGFGRNLDYYTGYVFEFRTPGRPELKPLVGGGRYDRLLGTLGASPPVPAVGCSLWIDRLAEAVR
jgi:ATP phosphoribosyltransferase regulatory subunit